MNNKVLFNLILKSCPSGSKNYTVFSVNKKKESIEDDYVVALDKPLSSKFIQNTINNEQDYKDNLDFLMTQYSATHFCYDKVYDYTKEQQESKLYLDSCKKGVFNMLSGRASSFILFGPSELEMKSQIFLDDNDGIIILALNDLFNFIEVNNEEEPRRIKVSMVCYLNDNVYDLQTNQLKPLAPKTKILEKEINSVNDFQTLSNKLLPMRKKIASSFIKSVDQTDLIFTFKCENNDGSVGIYHFIELSSVEYGVSEENESDFNRYIYENFHHISTCLIAAESGVYLDPENLNMFCRLYLKGLDCDSSDITFCSLVIGNAYPCKNNLKTLNFSSWIRNQVCSKRKLLKPTENDYNHSNSQKIKEQQNDQKTKIKSLKKESQQINDEKNESKDFDEQSHNINQSFKQVDANESGESLDRGGYTSIHNNNNNFSDEFSKELKKLQKLKKSKDNLKQQIKEKNIKQALETKVNKIVEEKLTNTEGLKNNNNTAYQIANQNYANTNYERNDQKISNNLKVHKEDKIKQVNSQHSVYNEPSLLEQNNIYKFELERFYNENVTLKNDNIILREDITRLNEINGNISNELEATRRKL